MITSPFQGKFRGKNIPARLIDVILHRAAAWLDMPEVEVMDMCEWGVVDPGDSEEGAANRFSGLGYRSVAAPGPFCGRSSLPAV